MKAFKKPRDKWVISLLGSDERIRMDAIVQYGEYTKFIIYNDSSWEEMEVKIMPYDLEKLYKYIWQYLDHREAMQHE